jgi:hypothetical protein
MMIIMKNRDLKLAKNSPKKAINNAELNNAIVDIVKG